MTTNQTAALLCQILAHPRVRELRPGWYGETCTACKGKGHYKGFDASARWRNLHCFHCHGTGKTESRMPDLLSPANLNDALELADKLFDHPPSLVWTDYYGNPVFQCAGFVNGKNPVELGPTRTAAVIAAIARALGMKRWI